MSSPPVKQVVKTSQLGDQVWAQDGAPWHLREKVSIA